MKGNQGKIVVVTGGASGIGAACAQVLSTDGYFVVVADINLDLAKQVAKRVGGVAQYLDVAELESVESAAKTIEKDLGPVYGLINSAGILQKPLAPHQLPMDIWDRVQRIDLRGTYISCLAFGRSMLDRKTGSIVNITSITAHRSVPLHSYAPAKAAVLSMTQCLAAEWGPSKVRVNSVAPGYVLTPALADAVHKGERNLELIRASAPMNDTVDPTQVGDAASFLLSDRAKAITGIDLPVDQGWLAGNGWATYGGFRSPV